MIEKLGITPGPWETNGHGVQTKEIRQTLVRHICVAPEDYDSTLHDIYLISAAPEMLEVLINIFDGIQQDGDVLKRDIYQMKDIIEKATGRTWEEVKELINEAD
jgi:hypothetical protein